MDGCNLCRINTNTVSENFDSEIVIENNKIDSTLQFISLFQYVSLVNENAMTDFYQYFWQNGQLMKPNFSGFFFSIKEFYFKSYIFNDLVIQWN